jgi:phosphoribosylanthranilate isomerase
MGLRVKICGIMQPEQGKAIAALGADSIGFICVKASPRYVTPEQIQACAEVLPGGCDRVGVFMDATVETIVATVQASGLTSVQLHGAESIEFCQALRSTLKHSNLAEIELIKAFRVKSDKTLTFTKQYESIVDWLLLDAYHPTMGGGTGLTLDWRSLEQFKCDRPWLLAGGLTPDNVVQALEKLSPQGIDLSSGVELSPGNKNLDQVAQLFKNLNNLNFS